MIKVTLTTLGLATLILMGANSDSDQVFYATKIIGLASGLATVAFWTLWARGKDL